MRQVNLMFDVRKAIISYRASVKGSLSQLWLVTLPCLHSLALALPWCVEGSLWFTFSRSLLENFQITQPVIRPHEIAQVSKVLFRFLFSRVHGFNQIAPNRYPK